MRYLRHTLVVALSVCTLMYSAQSKVSNKTSTWNDATAWTPSGVPTATDNVLISNGNLISISSAATCSNLTIGSLSTASLAFSGNSSRALTINGDVINNGNFYVPANSNATHSVNVSGDIQNNGLLNLNADFNSRAGVTFNNTTSDQVVTGTGAKCAFYRIAVSKGSLTHQLNLAVSNFSATSNFLLLNSGVIRFAMATTGTFVPATTALVINSNSGLWLDSPVTALSFSSSVTNSGLFRVTSGTVDIGNAANEDLIATGGTLEIQGGDVDIAGKYQATTVSTVFKLSGGKFRMPSVSTSNTGISPFNLTATGSTFDMTGGTIIVRREGGSGTQDLGFVNTGGTLGTVSGGTVQFGDASTPASQTVNVNSVRPFPNVVIASGNITVKLSTNPLTVLNDVNITAGTLNSTSLTINAQGNWQNSGTFTPGTGTVNFSASTTQTISRTSNESFNHVMFSGSGLKILSTPITATGNFSIASGSTVDVSTSNYSVSIAGNFVNDGYFNTQTGLVRFNGTSAQSISGSSTTDFRDLTITNATGVTMNAAANIKGSLTLTNGVLNTNSQVLTIVSDANGSGRIGTITGTGNLNGNVTIQRYLPGGSTGWTLFGAPIVSGLTFNDLDDDLYITCPTCPDGFNNFYSVYSYDETQTGSYDSPGSYVPVTSLSTPLVPGKGYWIYVGTSQFTTTGVTVDVTGPIIKFAYSIPITRTNSGSAIDDGWNLVHNPYPSAVSWTALKGATANLDNAVYVYNPDLNGGSGAYASYVNGISSPAIASGGVGDNIAMGQGFYVHSTGATALSAIETNKVNADPTMLHPSAGPSLVRFNLASPVYRDEALLYFQQGSTLGFDNLHDAFKMRGQDPLAPTIQLYNQGDQMQINGVPPLTGTFSTMLQVLTGYSGTYTLSAIDANLLPKGICFSVRDRANNQTFDLRNGDYVFYLADTTIAPRFEISMESNPVNLTAQVQQPVCLSPASGSVTANITAGQGPWNYKWKVNGTLVRNVILNQNSDVLGNLSSGVVDVEIYKAAECAYAEGNFNIVPVINPVAAFVAPDTVNINQSFQVMNNSVNGDTYSWDFGDGSAGSSLQAPSYFYQQTGLYSVKLITQSSTMCSDTAVRSLRVVDLASGIAVNSNDSGWKVKFLGSGLYTISTGSDAFNGEIKIMDLQGRVISTKKVSASDIAVDLHNFPAGIYGVAVSNGSENKNYKLINN